MIKPLLNYNSPNYGERHEGADPRYIILHFTGMEGAQAACERLCDPQFEVSSHYLIAEDGQLFQLVDTKKRAWHAGASYWAGETDMNSASIGIEIDNNGAQPFKDQQYNVLIELLRELRRQYDIPATHILGHSDIAPARKFDPGPWFDWQRLDHAGVSSPPQSLIDSDDFLELAASAGYQTQIEMGALLLAIRMRHGSTPYFGALRPSDYSLLRQR